MPWINHVNTDKINETASKGRSDPQSVKRTMKLERKWVFDNEQPQFVTELAYDNKGSRAKVSRSVQFDTPDKCQLNTWLGSYDSPSNYFSFLELR